jgi:hypothetical protein
MNTAKRLLLISAGILLSTAASAIPVAIVGGVDTLLAKTTLGNSGSSTEVTWINSVLGTSLQSPDYLKTDVTAADWLAVDGLSGVFSFSLDSPADAYLIKIGNNSGSAYTHFLFSNTDSQLWATINLTAMGFDSKNTLNIGKVSHIGAGPASTEVAVPEPSSLGLLVAGLLGVGATLLRKRRVVAQADDLLIPA